MIGGLTSWRAVASSVGLALGVLLAACGSEISVAQPKETGYGDAPSVEVTGTTDAATPAPAERPRDGVDADTPRSDSDAGGASAPGVDVADAAVPVATAPDAGRAPASSVKLPTLRERHLLDEPRFNVTRPVDLTQVEGPLPIVVWANSGCSRDDAAGSPLFERWASAGFVVLSLSGELGLGVFDLLALLETTTAADHARLIDWVVAQNAAGPYAGKLDLTRIVVAGNACGGRTALEVLSTDTRPAGALVLSGSSARTGVNDALVKSIAKPVGYVVGGDEDLASDGAAADYAALRDTVPAMLVRRRAGDLQTLSASPGVLREVADIALDWMDLLLYGVEPAFQALTSANVCGACTPGDWKLEAKQLDTLKH
jgi:hypothetical protein